MITCASCGRKVEGEIADETPCPTCGTPLLAGKPVEVDPAWVAEKQARADAYVSDNAPKKSRTGYIVLGLVMAVMVGVIAVMIFQRQPAARGVSVGEIELRITAPKDGTDVVIDGAPAGKTPLVIRLPKGETPIRIIGNLVAITVIPDRNRTIHLVQPKRRR